MGMRYRLIMAQLSLLVAPPKVAFRNQGLFRGNKFGQNWIRTSVGLRQRVYSPSPLATRTSAHKPVMGFEPATDGLQNRCSTIELHRHNALWGARTGILLVSLKPCQWRMMRLQVKRLLLE